MMCRFRVITYDWRGFGDLSQPRAHRMGLLWTHADEVDEALLAFVAETVTLSR